jgi:peptide/nickel transport system permease protein
VLRRAAGLLAVWTAVVAAAFLMLRLMPGDPAAILAESTGTGGAGLVAELRADWGLDRPLAEQFGAFLGGLVTGDAGRSLVDGRPVLADLAARAPRSAAIGVGGLALATAAGFTLGFLAARRPGGLYDSLTRALAVAGQALPAFAVGLVLLWVLAAELRVIRPLTGGPLERIVLPMLLVALFSTGAVARLARAGFAETVAASWYRTALAKGLSPGHALWRHGRRHAGLTVLAGLVPEVAWAVGGTAVAEIVFGTGGLSERVVAAVAARDYPVLQAYAAMVAALMLATRAMAGLLRARLDPRPAA